jgi:hypothetical protein
MQNKHLIIFLTLFLFQNLIAQKSFTINGYIEDASSGERLIGAAVFDSTARLGTVTNNYGYFNLSSPQNLPTEQEGTEGPTYLRISYIGYQTERITLNIRGDTTLNIKLSTKNTLQELEVNAQKQDRIEDRVQMSQVIIPIEQIKRMPMILGEADVLKSLQFLPGVKAGTEGTSGIQVRGGSQDQNLFLLDGVPVYNATHIGGLFSIFNADALKSVTLTKGGFPARFGGRLSSVVEVNTKDGDYKTFHANGSVGLLSTKLTLEGPILKDKVSYTISARRTYFDLLLKALTDPNSTLEGGGKQETTRDIYFYDINAKINARLNNKHSLFFNIYRGSDLFATNENTMYPNSVYKSENGFNFVNNIGSLRWNWILNNKLFLNATAYYTKYELNFNEIQNYQFEKFPFQKDATFFKTSIGDAALKLDFDYYITNNYSLKFGVSSINHRFLPNKLEVQGTGQRDTILGNKIEQALENDIYVENNWAWKNIKINAGLRFSHFSSKNTSFNSVQPRLNINYLLLPNLSVKGSYSKSTQFIHSLVNDALGFPTDSWIPSVLGVLPAQSNQYAIGIAKTLGNNYEFSVEGYFKDMDKIVAYKEGTGFLNINPQWERNVTQGKGESYGLEFLLQKKEGRLSGWVSYTLSKSTRQFEEINGGLVYPFKYDRRHELAIVGMYKLKPNITFSMNWTFATGNAITLPATVYNLPVENFPNFIEILSIIDYAPRNSYQTQPIHRLDIGIEFFKKKKKYDRTWNLGFYNAYNKANPYYFYFENSQGTTTGAKPKVTTKYEVKQFNLLPILPYFSYGIKF